MLLPGDRVRIRPAAEILQTLDADQTLDGLPFMPEMLPFAGGVFRVAMRADRTCVYPPQVPFRRLRDCVVLQGLRCDGSSHGGCQLGCMTLWKEAWLAPVSPGGGGEVPDPDEPAGTLHATRNHAGEVYSCQATGLPSATTPGDPFWSPSQYVRLLQARTFTLGELIGMFGRPLLRRVVRVLNLALRRPPPARIDHGAALGLRAGELVEVKSRQEIIQTLDARGTNKGLGFGGEMLAYCGRRGRVSQRVETVVDESTGRLRHIRDTVALEGAVCDRYLGCARGMPLMWREVWLRRVEPDSPQGYEGRRRHEPPSPT